MKQNVKTFPITVSINFRTQYHRKNKRSNLTTTFQKNWLKYEYKVYIDGDRVFKSSGYTLLGKIFRKLRIIK